MSLPKWLLWIIVGLIVHACAPIQSFSQLDDTLFIQSDEALSQQMRFQFIAAIRREHIDYVDNPEDSDWYLELVDFNYEERFIPNAGMSERLYYIRIYLDVLFIQTDQAQSVDDWRSIAQKRRLVSYQTIELDMDHGLSGRQNRDHLEERLYDDLLKKLVLLMRSYEESA